MHCLGRGRRGPGVVWYRLWAARRTVCCVVDVSGTAAGLGLGPLVVRWPSRAASRRAALRAAEWMSLWVHMGLHNG